MEERLAEFRARKLKEKRLTSKMSTPSPTVSENCVSTHPSNGAPISDADEVIYENDCGFVARMFKKLYTINFLLKFSLWICLQIFFTLIQFGAVYFITSLLVIMYYSMKENQRKPHEPSAYSVFNRNCERINGTFLAEQFEQQMIYGGAAR